MKGDKRQIVVKTGPGPMLMLGLRPAFNVGRPFIMGSRRDILELATVLSEITNWQVVNEEDTLQ